MLDPRHHDLQPVDLLEGGLHGRVLLLQIWEVLLETNAIVVLCN